MGRIAILLGVLALAGCGSAAPITYLHLAPVPAGVITASSGTLVAVAQVTMPASIDRLALTTETSGSTLGIDQNAKWAAPLDGMATSVLAQNLASRLPGTTVIMPGEVMPQGGKRVVHVNVLRFLPVVGAHGAHVALDAGWQVLATNGTIWRSGRSRFSVPTAPGAAAEARAMSTALGELSDRIAEALAGA